MFVFLHTSNTIFLKIWVIFNGHLPQIIDFKTTNLPMFFILTENDPKNQVLQKNDQK